MGLNKFMESYAKEIGGEYLDYDKFRSVIVISLSMGRFQTVVGKINDKDQQINLSSKVCLLESKIDFKRLLEENHATKFGKFCITNGFLKVEANVELNTVSDKRLKEIIQEVAQLADKWEFKITNKDIF